jgi:hypothetical protein
LGLSRGGCAFNKGSPFFNKKYMDYNLLIEKAKNYLKIPAHPTFVRYGWNNENNTTSLFSGHNLITWDTFNSMIDTTTVYRDYDAQQSATYYKGEIVKHNNSYYKAIRDIIVSDSHNVNSNSDFIKTSREYELINLLIEDSIIELFQSWSQNVTLETGFGEVIENFYGSIDTYEMTNLISDNEIYGIQFVSQESQNTKLVIDKILIYSSKNITADIEIIDNRGNSYIESDVILSENRVNVIELTNVYETYSNEVSIKIQNDNFLVQSPENLQFPKYLTLFGIDKNVNESYSNFGISANVTYVCDYTNVIANNLTKFVRPIVNQFAIKCIELFAYNPLSTINRLENNIDKSDLQYELDKSPESGGISLRRKLYYSMKSIKPDFFPKDGICIGCSKPRVLWSSM